MFDKTFDRRVYLFLAVKVGAVSVGLCFGYYALWPANVERGYQPEQPIAFSHALHAGTGKYVSRDNEIKDQLGIPCLYCHTEAEKGAHATVPPLSTCMNCHAEVQTQLTAPVTDDHGYVQYDSEGKMVMETKVHPEIQKILDAYESGESIRWIKVHDLADFVYFDHSRHTNAGVECVSCHGEVEKMDVVKRTYSLKMGWCLTCHNQPPEANTSPEYKAAGIKGPIHCSACHR